MCMFALTVSTAEPKNIKEEMADSAWIKAMQDELHQFDRLQVRELVDKPFDKTVIKLKWKRVLISKNLLFQSLAWKLFRFLSPTMHTNLFQYVSQPEGFVNPDYPKKLQYKESSICIEASSKSLAKYALEILKKHGIERCESLGTPLATKPKLDADLSGTPVDQTKYNSMIGSLMYLTSSRPDIVQADSGFKLTPFLDDDHARCIDTRKITSRGIQFLSDKLVSWMSKKQDCTAMSSAEAEASPSNGVEWGAYKVIKKMELDAGDTHDGRHVFWLCSTIASVVCAFADDDEESDPYLGEASRSPCFVQCDKGESDSYLGGASRIRVCCHGGSATLKFELNDTTYKMEDTYAVVRSCQVTHLLLNVWHVFWLCSTIASVVCAFADDDGESDPYLGEASRSPVCNHGESNPYLGGASQIRVCRHGGSATLKSELNGFFSLIYNHIDTFDNCKTL
ncbi:hypothetical protein Tco_0014602 [Tanacetum coccineum]